MLTLDHRFMFDGQAVAWGRFGSGQPLVLVHGTPFSSQVWRKIAPLLAQHWTIHVFDLLGYGQSEQRAGQDVSLAVQDKLMAALLKHCNVQRPHVLAHDFGAATALRGYYLDRLRYASLTLFDAVALAPWGSPFVQHVKKHQEAFEGLPDYAHEALLRAYLQGAAFQTLHPEALEIYAAPWRGERGKTAFYRQIAQMDQSYTDEVEPLYGQLDCPVQILWGEEDEWVPITQGEKLAALISNRPLIRIAQAGHLVQEDAPEAIVAAMLSGIA